MAWSMHTVILYLIRIFLMNKQFFTFLILLITGVISCAANNHTKEDKPAPVVFNVGYTVLDLEYQKAGKTQKLTVAVWYPTAAQAKEYTYGGSTKGIVAADAALLEKYGPYPLMVFSHGYSGGGIGSVFFTEKLAARGWIVAAPDHHDRHSAVRIRTGHTRLSDRLDFFTYVKEIVSSSPKDRVKYLYRLDEMKLVLDRMVSHPLFGKFIDAERIAVGGHSFGGYTALGLCGTIKERHDTRIKSVLLYSTGAGGYLYSEKELQQVKIPSMLFIGERERDQMRGDKTMLEVTNKIYRSMPSPKYYIEVKGGKHASFNNHFLDKKWTGFLGGTEEHFKVIRKYSIAFLEKHVAERKDCDRVLEQTDPMVSRFLKKPIQDTAEQDASVTERKGEE
jgi:predicted dienelactone hydrolase